MIKKILFFKMEKNIGDKIGQYPRTDSGNGDR
jgi:hypothetical protein